MISRAHGLFSVIAVLGLELVFSASSVASPVTLTWTLQQNSSAVWQSDPYFGALSNNPQDIFANTNYSSTKSVDFVGFSHSGGSTETLNDAYLVYRWRLDFSALVQIDSIVMAGFGDQRGTSQMRLLDDSGNVLSSNALSGFNTFSTNVLGGSGVIGSTFYYDEYDVSTDGRYRSYLSAAYTPIPEPSAFALFAIGLGGAVLLALKKNRSLFRRS